MITFLFHNEMIYTQKKILIRAILYKTKYNDIWNSYKKLYIHKLLQFFKIEQTCHFYSCNFKKSYIYHITECEFLLLIYINTNLAIDS